MSNGVISFDLDGVLANFTRGFTRLAHRLYGTPVGDGTSQGSWMFEEVPQLGLSAEQVGHPIRGGGIWGEVIKSKGFWANLDPFNPSAMYGIDRIQNKIFITNRLGVLPLEQSITFLERWGVIDPKVIVAEHKGPIAVAENVVAHIDDYYPNCVAISNAVPGCYTALLHVPHNLKYHAEWNAQGGEIVLSVDHFIHEADKRGLIEWAPVENFNTVNV